MASELFTDVDDEYQAPGYGSGPYTFLNGGFTTSQPFSQSVDVYINANWAPAAAAGVPSFWLDMSPNQPPNYAAENSFQFTATGSGVLVGMTGQAPNLNIAQSGWYDFQMLYEPDQANPATMDTVLSVYNVNNTGTPENLLASSTFADGPLDITGTGYIWFTVWQNGFAGDSLNVADVQASVVPDASCTLPLLGVGFGVLSALRRRVARA